MIVVLTQVGVGRTERGVIGGFILSDTGLDSSPTCSRVSLFKSFTNNVNIIVIIFIIIIIIIVIISAVNGS